jgi:hypothetical protein
LQDVSSVLVLDHHKKAHGFLDFVDLAAFCVFVLDATPLGSAGLEETPEQCNRRIRERLLDTNVRAIVDFGASATGRTSSWCT